MQLVLVFTIFFFIHLFVRVYQGRRLAVQRARFIANHGCQATGPSYPHKTGLFGMDFFYENFMNVKHRRFAEGVRERFQLYGTTHSSRLLWGRMINTIDPENLQAIMKTNFEDYTIIPNREKLMRVFFGIGVFGTEGMEWRHSRQLVRTSMYSLHLDGDLFEGHFQRFIERIRESGGERRIVDFGKHAFDYTFAVATGTIVGGSRFDKNNEGVPFDIREAHEDIDQFGKDFTVLGRMARVLTLMINQIPYLPRLVYRQEYSSAQQRVFDYVDNHIHQAHSRQHYSQSPSERPFNDEKSFDDNPNLPSKPTTLLEGLAAQTDDIERIRSETLHLLLAGHDTVGIALSELFWCLSRKPAIWAKLRAEVDSAFQGTTPPTSSLRHLPYLQCIIKEAIRIRPTLAVHGRRSVRDTVLPRGGGPDGLEPLFIPKGTTIIYSNYALYRNPAVFGADVNDFRPERWEHEANPARYEYLSFGAGPRYCPGRELGWIMIAYAVVRLAQTVRELRSADERPWEEARAFSFHNRHGVLLEMVPT